MAPRRANTVDADVVSGDWRVRADQAPRIPAADVLRSLGIAVPENVTVSVFVDSEDVKGATLVLVIRPIPHEAVQATKGTLLALWGRVGQALPYLAPWLGGRR